MIKINKKLLKLFIINNIHKSLNKIKVNKKLIKNKNKNIK